MKPKTLNIIALTAIVAGFLAMALVCLTGCVNNPTVNIPDNAPVWASEPVVLKNPFYLAAGNVKTQAKGTYTFPAGSLVYHRPATQPSK